MLEKRNCDFFFLVQSLDSNGYGALRGTLMQCLGWIFAFYYDCTEYSGKV